MLTTQKAPRVILITCLAVTVFAAVIWQGQTAERALEPWGRLEDIPTYPGAQGETVVQTTNSNELSHNETRTITFQTKAAPEQVVAFYKDSLAGRGFRVAGDEQAPGTTELQFMKDPNANINPFVSVYITTEVPANGLTAVEVRARISREY